MESLEGCGLDPSSSSSSCGLVEECEALTPSFVSLDSDEDYEDFE